MQENCVLLYQAQELAKERGFNPELVACAYLALCKGEKCLLIEENKKKIKEAWRRKRALNERK